MKVETQELERQKKDNNSVILMKNLHRGFIS